MPRTPEQPLDRSPHLSTSLQPRRTAGTALRRRRPCSRTRSACRSNPKRVGQRPDLERIEPPTTGFLASTEIASSRSSASKSSIPATNSFVSTNGPSVTEHLAAADSHRRHAGLFRETQLPPTRRPPRRAISLRVGRPVAVHLSDCLSRHRPLRDNECHELHSPSLSVDVTDDRLFARGLCALLDLP